jgi:signal transduction histidine kinase
VLTQADLWGDFDPLQIQQALLNLVLNAIEACAAGDEVTLSTQAKGGFINIHVTDPVGPIPASMVERLFEPLFTTKLGGNGLGLAIARNIGRAHGGDVVLTANQPSRVCFSIMIPVSQP